MLIALCQISTADGDVKANIERHVRAVGEAAAAGARLALFPELSLTGYILNDIARNPALTVNPDDSRLSPLRRECRRRSVTAVIGAPTRRSSRAHLSALVIGEDGEVSVYDKRNLFEAEGAVFTAGRADRVIKIDGRRLALGICADLSDDAQATEAGGADAWLLGVLLSVKGYRGDADRAAEVARRHQIPVVLANHGGSTGGWIGAGRSGMWAAQSEPVLADPGTGVWLIDLDAPARPALAAQHHR